VSPQPYSQNEVGSHDQKQSYEPNRLSNQSEDIPISLNTDQNQVLEIDKNGGSSQESAAKLTVNKELEEENKLLPVVSTSTSENVTEIQVHKTTTDTIQLPGEMNIVSNDGVVKIESSDLEETLENVSNTNTETNEHPVDETLTSEMDIESHGAATTELPEKTLENMDQGESFYSAVSSMSERDINLTETQCSKTVDPISEEKPEIVISEKGVIEIRKGGIYPHLSVMYKNLTSDFLQETCSQVESRNKLTTTDQATAMIKQDQCDEPITNVVTSVGQVKDNQPMTDKLTHQTEKPVAETVTPSAPMKMKLKIQPVIETPQMQRTFQPLTLEQLQSLYYNPELLNSVQYIDQFIQVSIHNL